MDDAEFQRLVTDGRRMELEKLEQSFGNDPGAILAGLYLCLIGDLAVPTWLRDSFLTCYVKGLHGRQDAVMDEVLGRPPRTKTQMDKFMRRLKAPKEIWIAVAEAKDRGEPIDNDLFEKGRQQIRLSKHGNKKTLRCLALVK